MAFFKGKVLGPRIKELAAQGLSYREIADAMGLKRLDSIYYHLKPKVRERHITYLKTYKSKHIKSLLKLKISAFNHKFKSRKKPTPKELVGNREMFSHKVRQFRHKGSQVSDLTSQQVLDKFGLETTCYLTGDKIDLTKPRTFEFDHIVPTAKGGDNSINNLGICTRNANRSKFDLTVEEYISLCEKVVANKDKLLSRQSQIEPDEYACFRD